MLLWSNFKSVLFFAVVISKQNKSQMFTIHRSVAATPNDSPAKRTNMVKLEEEQGWWTGCYRWFNNHYRWCTEGQTSPAGTILHLKLSSGRSKPYFRERSLDDLFHPTVPAPLTLGCAAMLWETGKKDSLSPSGAHPGWLWWLKDFG